MFVVHRADGDLPLRCFWEAEQDRVVSESATSYVPVRINTYRYEASSSEPAQKHFLASFQPGQTKGIDWSFADYITSTSTLTRG
jgi:hypothetical protein